VTICGRRVKIRVRVRVRDKMIEGREEEKRGVIGQEGIVDGVNEGQRMTGDRFRTLLKSCQRVQSGRAFRSPRR